MNVEEFTTEVECLRPVLFSVAKRYVNDNDIAEDMVQDTFLKLWQMSDELHPPVASLAKVMVHNLCLDYYRHSKPVCSLEEDTMDIIEDESVDHERIEKLMKVVSELPSLQQTILRLRHMEGMPMSEIARLIGSNEIAVRKALSRARMAVINKYINAR